MTKFEFYLNLNVLMCLCLTSLQIFSADVETIFQLLFTDSDFMRNFFKARKTTSKCVKCVKFHRDRKLWLAWVTRFAVKVLLILSSEDL